MIHRGTTRESRIYRERISSTPTAKARRHKNKLRIWKRAIKRLAEQELAPAAA